MTAFSEPEATQCRSRKQRRESSRTCKDVNKAAGADAKRCGRAAAPAKLRASFDDIGGIGTRRDVEHEAGYDKEPEIVNAKHAAHRNSGVPGTNASKAAQNCAR
jgi:hypothetical protein